MLIAHARQDPRRYRIRLPSAPEDARRERMLELLVGVDRTATPGRISSLDRGALVDVEGPLGTFTFPDPTGRPALSVHRRRHRHRAAARDAAPRAHDAARQHRLFYSARTPDEFAYENELRALAERGTIELRQTVTRATGARTGPARADASDRDTLAPLVHDPATLCFVCGPPALVDEVPQAAGRTGHRADANQDRRVDVKLDRRSTWKPASTISTSPVIAA